MSSPIAFPRKHTVEYLGGSRLRTTCKTCGHKNSRCLMIGPRGMRKPIAPSALVRLIKYWQGIEGVTMTCLGCKKLAESKANNTSG